MRRAANVDKNHAMIVAAFRAHGASVQSLAPVGKGCPDLVVGFRGQNFLVEVKAHKPGTVAGDLQLEQATWHRLWNGQVCVVRTIPDIEALLERAW